MVYSKHQCSHVFTNFSIWSLSVLITPSRQEAINMEEGCEGGGIEAMHSCHTVATFSLEPRLLPCRKTGKTPLPVFLQGRSLGTRLAN